MLAAKAGAKCAVLTLEAGSTPERVGTLGGARVAALPVLWGRHRVPRPSFASLEEVRAAVEGSDVVHLMNHWGVLNAAVCLLARRAGKPYVVCPAGALPIYGRSSRQGSRPSRCPPRGPDEQNIGPTSCTPGSTT